MKKRARKLRPKAPPPHEEKLVKTALYCHNCDENFVATLDMGLDGNHEILCPHCRHVHYRVIRGGVVTGERYNSANGPVWSVANSSSRTVLKTLPEESVQTCVTSPPYWGLRDYGVVGQMGLEKSPDEYVAGMVEVFREVRRVVADDGTLWLNVGDSYAASGRGGNPVDSPHQKQRTNRGSVLPAGLHEGARVAGVVGRAWSKAPPGYKPKDLVGIPWMLAFALRSDGWFLRCDIIWSKPNPMPESVTDRPTKAHEYVFLLSKAERYFYDAAVIREPMKGSSVERLSQNVEAQIGSERANGGTKTNGTMKAVRRTDKQRGHSRRHDGFNDRWDAMERGEQMAHGANCRSVWSIATMPYSGAHFATFPPELARRCILAGSRPGDTVLDPFGGSGTVASVATGHGRSAIHIDLKYHELARERIGPMLCEVA